MTDEQLYLIICVPLLFQATLIGILMAWTNAKFDGIQSSVNARFDAVDAKFTTMDKRFDDMRELWRVNSTASRKYLTPD